LPSVAQKEREVGLTRKVAEKADATWGGRQICPATGELIYIGYNLVPTDGVPSVTVGVVGPDGAVTHRVTVPCARPSMQHDVAITRTRTVLLDGPLIFNIEKSLQGGRPFDFDLRCGPTLRPISVKLILLRVCSAAC
jgi:hypothetical protein